jgi:activating signal cointegrator complex subunit 3
MATMNKPCYAAINQHSPDRPSLIFVASRRQTRLTAFDLISFAARDENPKVFLGCDDSYIDAISTSIQDEALRHTIVFGIGLREYYLYCIVCRVLCADFFKPFIVSNKQMILTCCC